MQYFCRVFTRSRTIKDDQRLYNPAIFPPDFHLQLEMQSCPSCQVNGNEKVASVQLSEDRAERRDSIVCVAHRYDNDSR